jgi:flagellar hook assembly protein FlgD
MRVAWRGRAEEAGRADIYDVTGRRLRSIAFADRSEGVHVLEWDGKTDGGVRVGSGVYFVRLVSPRRSLVEKLVLVR